MFGTASGGGTDLRKPNSRENSHRTRRSRHHADLAAGAVEASGNAEHATEHLRRTEGNLANLDLVARAKAGVRLLSPVSPQVAIA